jgi:hypothetical protein
MHALQELHAVHCAGELTVMPTPTSHSRSGGGTQGPWVAQSHLYPGGGEQMTPTASTSNDMRRQSSQGNAFAF